MLPEISNAIAWLASEARALGGVALGVTDTQFNAAGLADWLSRGWYGDMDYMARNQHLRAHPEELLPGTTRIVSVAFPYLPERAASATAILQQPAHAYVSRYALGRDYHKVIRKQLQTLAERMTEVLGQHHYRVFTDSAPLLEVTLAVKAGLGWRGKNTLLLSRQAGSFCFLGDILTDLPLPVCEAQPGHCGNCQKCMDCCPTQAIIAPYQLDARRCISYLTIEHKGSIPVELRPLIGNRIYGCDDCQLVCPWNRFAQTSRLPDWAKPRHSLDDITLCELFAWDEATFLAKTAGSAIRRIGYQRWLRNLAVALGNALRVNDDEKIRSALAARRNHPDEMVREHVAWALDCEREAARPSFR